MKLYLILMALVLNLGMKAQAAEQHLSQLEKHEFNGQDITELVKYFRQFVYTLRKDVLLYNWSENESYGDELAAHELIKERANTFWNYFGRGNASNNENSYGLGLYAAADPALTMSYGGKQWLLSEFRVPKGTQILEFSIIDQKRKMKFPESIVAAKSYYKCLAKMGHIIEPLFSFGGKELEPSCSALVKYILKDIIKVDAFSYQYFKNRYYRCKDSKGFYNSRAFVITSDRWINSNTLKTWNKNSVKDFEYRRMLQSFQVASSINQNYQGLTLNVVPEDFKKIVYSSFSKSKAKRTGSKLSQWYVQCNYLTCTVSFDYINPKNQSEFIEDISGIRSPIPPPAFLNKNSAESAGINAFWSDLDGQKFTADWDLFYQKKLFGCDGVQPYEI